MLKKMNLWALALLITTAYNTQAMPRVQEFENCLKKAVSDAEVTKCRTVQIEAVKKSIQEREDEIKEQKLLKKIANSKGESIEDMRNYFLKYQQSHCTYYVFVNNGNGYSDAYNKAKCELTDFLQYENDIDALYYTANSDIKG